jgi:uncharacterized protein (DUF2126 family)/transglutaminase-like putative cysteine protease
MTIRVALNHRTGYQYDRPVQLSAHLIRLRPAAHCRTPIRSYSLKVEPANHFVNWQQDPFGNHVARIVFPQKVRSFSITVDLVADLTVINPFDFFVEDSAKEWPFTYQPASKEDLAPYLKVEEKGKRLQQFLASLSIKEKDTVSFLVALNRSVFERVGYVVRMEAGVQTCEQTLEKATGSCRDSAWLLVQVLRNLGLAARFVSGYLVQLSSDVKSLDGADGPAADFTDLHAWAEVFVPGAGWIGLDPTSGLFAGEGHIPLCCTPSPASAAPITGFADPCKTVFDFANSVSRIYETLRVTKPFSETQWQTVLSLGDQIDKKLQAQGVGLTQGGEPTFVSIDDYDHPQWNTTALGDEKEILSRQLLHRLRQRFAVGGVLHHGQGKWYPGEPLPRWAYSCFFRRDGAPVWQDMRWLSPETAPSVSVADARRFSVELVNRLKVSPSALAGAYEDAAHYLDVEAKLPVDLDPYAADLKSPLERQRLTKLLARGLGEACGFVLPLHWDHSKKHWHSAPWVVRKEKIILLPGDSPMGLRLPLASLAQKLQKKPAPPARDSFEERDPLHALHFLVSAPSSTGQVDMSIAEQPGDVPNTAICIEPRNGRLWVFLPPLTHLEHWLALVAVLEATAKACGIAIELEGYEPPSDPRLDKFAITPDPGVIEVNIHPSASWRELVEKTATLYQEARLTRLGAEKFMLDGRHSGTGGGNHITLGGNTAAASPFLRRPDLLASFLVFWQNHPSLSYLFSGLFVGPTSQAPRIDEGRDDALYELEIALQQVSSQKGQEPWRVDRLFRNLLVDLTGNTHRAEFCIDKLYAPAGPAGRLGLVEFRAFEMPPHWQMSLAQSLLLRALVSCFWDKPYRANPVHWGTALHDRFMLRHYVERDFMDVIAFIRDAGIAIDLQWYAPFFEFRFPLCGSITCDAMTLSLHTAIEPWHVLGEEVSAQGTSRYVDSSVERLQVTITHLNPERYYVTCNRRRLPLQATEQAGEYVAAVRFKAWQPTFGLHPLLPACQQLVFDIVDAFNEKSIGGCTYHVSHPSGRNYDTLPVNANEAEARRVARFWNHGHSAGVMAAAVEPVNRAFPCTLDLRRT